MVSSQQDHDPSSRADAIIVHTHCPLPQLGSTISCHLDRGPPPLSESAIIVTISQHDTESTILDPPLRSLICDPQIIIHDVAAAAALDLRTIRQRDSGEEVESVTCIDEILIYLM